ncbi:hypothetical protein MKD33_08395, partial [Chromobacterium piscinae]
DGADFAAAV